MKRLSQFIMHQNNKNTIKVEDKYQPIEDIEIFSQNTEIVKSKKRKKNKRSSLKNITQKFKSPILQSQSKNIPGK